jgi:hypothetical protein
MENSKRRKMSIVSVTVNIVNGMGGPNHNAIPIYADNKAPGGEQVKGANGLQLMLENSNVSGVQYIIVNPQLITKEENEHDAYMSFKADGQVNYIHIWILNPKTGRGEDYAGKYPMWAEYSHLQVAEAPMPPTPPESDLSVFVIDWVNRTITLQLEG